MAHNNIAAVAPQESTADNDNPSAPRPKHYILPDGTPSFIRAEAGKPRTRYFSDRKRWTAGKVVSVLNLRLSDITKTIAGRHGGPCDTDEGEIYYATAVELLAKRWVAMMDDGRNPKPLDSQAWARKHCPKLATERPNAWFIEAQDAILAGLGAKHVRVPTADETAQALKITHAEVVAFKLRSVGAIDRDARQREIEERRADATRERNRRRKAGDFVPHSESMAQTKPWEAYGISEPTFRRWVKAGKVPAHPSQRVARAKSRSA